MQGIAKAVDVSLNEQHIAADVVVIVFDGERLTPDVGIISTCINQQSLIEALREAIKRVETTDGTITTASGVN